MPGSYAPAWAEKHNSFVRLFKKKGCKEESMTKVWLYAIGTSTTLESNKRLSRLGVKDGQKCPFKDSHVAAITLITPCRGSGDHSSLTRSCFRAVDMLPSHR